MEALQEISGFMGSLEPSATMSITSKAKAMKAAGEDVCSLCAGEPDFDTPEHIKQAAIEALNSGETKYTPASGMPALKKVIANKFINDNNIQTTPEQIVIAPGGKFSVFSAIAALCGESDEVIITAPYWVSYPEMIKGAGAKSVVIECKAENNYELAPADLEAVVTPRTKLLILNSPSNPSGTVYRKETLEAIADIAVRNNFMVLSDEIYEKLTYDAEYPHISIASLSPEIADLTITVNGLSKAYSMTGWRLGYLTAPLWLAKRISALQSHTTSNPTTFAQFGGLAAITESQQPVEEMRQAFAKRRDLIYNLMNAIPGIKCIRPAGAFYIFVDISSFGIGSQEFANRLLEQEKMAVVPGAPFGAEGNVRMSYACAEAQIEDAAVRMRKFCESL